MVPPCLVADLRRDVLWGLPVQEDAWSFRRVGIENAFTDARVVLFREFSRARVVQRDIPLLPGLLLLGRARPGRLLFDFPDLEREAPFRDDSLLWMCHAEANRIDVRRRVLRNDKCVRKRPALLCADFQWPFPVEELLRRRGYSYSRLDLLPARPLVLSYNVK